MADDSRYAAQMREYMLPDITRKITTALHQQIGAAYASLEYSAGRWELSAGLLDEYTSNRIAGLRRSISGCSQTFPVSRALNALRTWLLVAQ